jgi:hypothetical protein
MSQVSFAMCAHRKIVCYVGDFGAAILSTVTAKLCKSTKARNPPKPLCNI